MDISVDLPILAAGVGAEFASPNLAQVEASLSTLREGIPWDTCAGAWLIPTKTCFVSWDKQPIQYRVNGSVGTTHSQGTGELRSRLQSTMGSLLD